MSSVTGRLTARCVLFVLATLLASPGFAQDQLSVLKSFENLGSGVTARVRTAHSTASPSPAGRAARARSSRSRPLAR